MMALIALLFASSFGEDEVLARSAEFPETYREAVQQLIGSLPDDVETEFAQTPYYELVRYHFSLGMSVRNSMGLWEPSSSLHQWFEQKGISHPDGMSGKITRGAWLIMNNCALDLDYPLSAVFSDPDGQSVLVNDLPEGAWRDLPPAEMICPRGAPLGESPYQFGDETTSEEIEQ